MTTEVESEKGIARPMGTIMVILWVLIIGVIGALLLGGVAYSMHAKNLILGLLCSILLFSPLLLTVAWGFEMWRQGRRRIRVQRQALFLKTEAIDSPTR